MSKGKLIFAGALASLVVVAIAQQKYRDPRSFEYKEALKDTKAVTATERSTGGYGDQPRGTDDPLFVAQELLGRPTDRSVTVNAAARKDVNEMGALDVPMHIRNAPTALMEKLGYSAGYKYPHNFAGNYVPEAYLPDELRGRVSAVNSVFISSSNELGAFRAGSMAQWVGAVNAVVIGGFAILAIVAMQAKAFPELRRMKSIEGQAR